MNWAVSLWWVSVVRRTEAYGPERFSMYRTIQLVLLFLVGCVGLRAQTTQTRQAPDCTINFVFTATGASTVLNNVPQVASGQSTGGCVYWSVKADTFATGAGTIVFQMNPTSNSPGTAPSSSGWTTFVPISGFTSLGTNPTSAFPWDYETAGNAPWLRVNCTAYTSGTIRGSIMGWRKLSASAGGGGSGGLPGGSVNDIQWKLDSTTFGGGRCTMDSSQNVVCGGSLSAGSGSGTTGKLELTGSTSGAASVLTVDDTNTATSIKFPNDATSGLRLATTPTATPASGCAEFSGTGTQLTSTGSACGSGGGGGSGGFTAYSGPAETLPAAGVTFFPPGGGGPPSTTENDVQGISPAATISSFHVTLSDPIGMGNTVTFTWRKTGVDQTVTCSISGAVAISCSDTTHSFSVASGDLLSISATTTGTVVITPEIVMLFSTGSGAGGSTTSVHHQAFVAGVHQSDCAGSGADVGAMINGLPSTNLCLSNPIGVMGPIGASTEAIIYVFIPPTWANTAMVLTVDVITSTNGTGNFSFTPSYLCQAPGADMKLAGSYTAGSTVTQAAPGGSGSGFYRVSFPLSFTPTCNPSDAIQIKFTRGASDTYSANVFTMGADLAMTY